jgi:serine/threonine protein kinase/tetratricopeptide (TPR) repeat protein
MNIAAQPAEHVDDLALGQVASDVNRCLRAGRQPNVEELVAQHPALAAQIRELVPALIVLEQLQQKSSAPVQETLRVLHDADAPGRLGDYQIVREIGRGGMGVVYEAEQISLSRRVALKVLPFAAVLDSKQLQRFKNEAQAAAHLHHQNIVPVYSVGCERGVHYYAMQYIEGQTLAEVIADLRRMGRRGEADSAEAPPHSQRIRSIAGDLVAGNLALPGTPTPGNLAATLCRPSSSPEKSSRGASSSTAPFAALSTERSSSSTALFLAVARLGVQAAQALEHAHSLGIVHRDIKPANLLVDLRGNLWITDFGLAHFQTDGGLTMTGDLVGTIRYMSPEQALAKRVVVDHRTDIYSLGATLYELLTLEPPFTGQDRQELLRQIAFEEPRLPRRIEKRIPTELETIVLMAISKNPAERYASAQALADDLASFLEDKPIKAKRPTVLERTARWSRRHKTLVSMGAATLVLVAIVASIGYIKTATALKRETDARQREAAARQDADAARAVAEKAQAKAKKAADIAQAINSFLLHDMLEQANPVINPGGDKLTARQLLDEAAKKIDSSKAFAQEPEVEAAVRHAIGEACNELAQHEEAEKQLRRALALRQQVIGVADLDTIITMNHLAWALRGIPGRLAEADTLSHQAADLCRRALGTDHPETIYAVDTLASVYLSQGKLKEAEAVERDNLISARRALGTDHERTRLVSNNLGWILQKGGKFAEAEELYRANREAVERLMPANHPDIPMAMNNLAFLLLARGKAEEAEPLFQLVIEICLNVLGSEHPHTILSLGNRGAALRDLDQLDEAEMLTRQSWDLCGRALVPEHPTTLTTLNKLVLVLERQGKTAEAEELAHQLFDARARVSGYEHPETLIAANSLAMVLERENKLADAERSYRTNLDMRRRVLGPEHPDTLQSMGNLARVLIQANKPADSLRHLREAIDIQRKGPPAVEAYLADHLGLLGWALIALGQAREAQPLLEESLHMHRSLFPGRNWRTAKIESILGGCLTALGKYDDAEPLVLSSYETLHAPRWAPPAQTSKSLDRVVQLYEAWGKPEQAAMWRNQRDAN